MCSLILPTTDIMSAVQSKADNNDEEDGVKGTKRKMSLANCGACGSEEAKYRCPVCLTQSCSLPCVKKHKEDSGCTGVRNKTAFMALSQFDEMALLSDYRFLEDTGRFADGANRDALIRAPRTSFNAKFLANNARKMNITLRFLPSSFTKSRENSTFFLKKERHFLWHLKLIFPQSNTEFSQKRVSDRKTLEEILTPYIHPTESDPVTRQRLKMYVHAPFEHVRVFMKAEGRKANSVRYHKLDIQKSLRDNLSYKMLIEYPVLHVVLRDHCQDYPLKGPAEPASARDSFATKSQVGDREMRELTQVSTSPQGSCTAGRGSIWMGTPETSPETEPPEEKRAKREEAREELEEGELVESSDEEREQEGIIREDTHLVRAGAGDGGAKIHDNVGIDMEVTKEEQADRVDNVDDGNDDDDGGGDDGDGFGKHNESSRSECLNEHITGSTHDGETRER
ncbi:hypothetical protein LDENG_00290060 [Lucifuga dentata]|nr:hypothetical protein LDENG_00290060 [Lucifuga dentata]